MSICNIQKLNNPAQVKLSLVCFHWAGGNGMAYKPMARVLEASGFAVYAVSLPGRNGRGTSAMFRRMADIINTLHTEFSAYHKANSLGDHPLIFFGHSFGGLVCFELYKSLIRKDDSHIVVDKIIVSAVRCPANLTEANKDASRVYHHKQTSKELIEYMHGIGGIPPGVDPEIIDMMIPTIQGDYEVFETYDASDFGSPVVACPLTLFLPKLDPSVEADVALGWEENTTEEFTLVEFPQGGHFYVTDNGTKDEFYRRLTEECEKHVASVWSCALN